MPATRSSEDGRLCSGIGADASVCPEIRRYSGTTDELRRFVNSTWSDAYQGRMTFPAWTTEYFDWQFSYGTDVPERRLAVYQDNNLIAVLLGLPFTFEAICADSEASARLLHGAQWSWLSVAKRHQGEGLAKQLDRARVSLEENAGSDLIVSFRHTGSKHSKAERPSVRFPLKSFHSQLGFWSRPLDGRRLYSWNLNRLEGCLARLLSPLLPKLAVPGNGPVRLFSAEDLESCRLAAVHQFRDNVLRIRWDGTSLAHQLLGSHLSKTVVAEVDGMVRGFVNFHILPFQSATEEPVAIIDLICVSQLTRHMQSLLLRTALGIMREHGAILALKLRSGDVAAKTMLATGFAARWPDSFLVLQWTQRLMAIPKKKPVHVLWR